MTFSYTAGSGTTRDRVRLLIADTRQQDAQSNTVYVFEDEELDEFIALAVSPYGAAALALRSLSAEQARTLTVRMGIAKGGVTISTKESNEALTKLAEMYEQKDADNVDADFLDWRSEDVDFAGLLTGADRFDFDNHLGLEFS